MSTHETVHKVPTPTHHYTLIRDPAGAYLGVDDDGARKLYDYVDDHAIWDRDRDSVRHVVSGQTLTVTGDAASATLGCAGESPGDDAGTEGNAVSFELVHGPEKMPSDYLGFFRENGWVCLTSVLAPETVEELERISCTDRYEDRKYDGSKHPLNQSWAVGRTAAEPVSLWLMRMYMGTSEVRLGHPPSLAILGQDDGKRDVQGWHSDFPYLWGFAGNKPYGRVPTSSGNTVLGIQRNVCISPFTREGGATAFKLGSHVHDQGPPAEWGTGFQYGQPGHRAKHGLPYNGPDADILEAPGGSIILYDSRTWHRAGVNQTKKRRSAMLQAMVPGYVMPFFDTSGTWKGYVGSDAYNALTDLERQEMELLMVHYINGPGGAHAITVDEDLSEAIRPQVAQRRYYDS